MPTFAEPLADNRAENLSSQNIKGYVYLPSMKKKEDPFITPWKSGSDYQWKWESVQ